MASSVDDFWLKSRSEPFEWGKNDCGLWVASYVEAATGQHPAKWILGRYRTALGCKRFVDAYGGLEGLARAIAGDHPEGDDVGVFKLEGHEIFGIKRGKNCAFKSEQGFTICKPDSLIAGWSITPK